ncbi:MAG TPA: hypothetical protein VIK78_00330 [Ruminiclostridium sp.]
MASKVINTILNLKDNFTPKIRQAADGVTRTKKEIQTMGRELKTGQNQINNFGSSLNNTFKSSTSLALKTTTAFAGLAAGLAIKTGFSEAMDLEGYRMQLETATKSTVKASQIMKYAVDLANKTPYEAGELVSASAKFEAMGLSAKKYLPLVGDMASATNKGVDQAVEALIDAQTGELERLKEFGITKAMIAKKSGEMFKGQMVINNKGQIVNQEKFNKALETIMVEKFKGGMDKQSTTLKGTWSTVTGITKSALSTMLGMTSDGTIKQGSLYDTLKKKVAEIANTFTKFQSDGTLQKLGSTLTNTVGKAFNVLAIAISFVKNNFNWLLPVMTGVLATFVAFNIITKAVLLFKTLSKVIKGVSAAQSILNFVMTANPIGAIALAIGLLIGIGVLLWKNWDTVKAKALQLWEGIKSAFAPVGAFFSSIWDGMKAGFSGLINFIISGINLWLKVMLTPFNLLIKAANLLPNVKIPEVSLKIPNIPSFALGTSYFKGGLARTDERGGEIKEYPNGTKIIPADKSKKMLGGMGGHTFNFYFNGNVGSEEFFEKAGNYILSKTKLALANM